MKISTEIGSAAHLIGEERAIESLAKAGFDAWDFSMFDMCRYDWSRKVFLPSDHPLASTDYLKFARKLKQIGLDNGIVCNQPHALNWNVLPFFIGNHSIDIYYSIPKAVNPALFQNLCGPASRYFP